jgi:hypothetical protein
MLSFSGFCKAFIIDVLGAEFYGITAADMYLFYLDNYDCRNEKEHLTEKIVHAIISP